MVAVIRYDTLVALRAVIDDRVDFIRIFYFEDAFLPEPEEVVGILKTDQVHGPVIPDQVPYFVVVFHDAGDAGKVRPEEEFAGEFPHGRPILQEVLRGQPRYVDIDVFKILHQKLRYLVPESPPAVAEDDLHIREIADHVVEGVGIGVTHLRALEEACPCMEHDGKTFALTFLVDGIQCVIVGVKEPVDGVDFEAFCAQP
ncbi:MAG: hypothetical protein A4E65_01530 [Syntrophorhabdus sp. PtaU1.Bin153]|nr:MAG: hypothetical protein A4E65_01530 [Syntrophorhabdus sp. PtaU1.Bin153]